MKYIIILVMTVMFAGCLGSDTNVGSTPLTKTQPLTRYEAILIDVVCDGYDVGDMIAKPGIYKFTIWHEDGGIEIKLNICVGIDPVCPQPQVH